MGGSLKKIKIKLPYDPEILEHASGENHTFKRYMHLNVHCSTIYNSQDMEVT